MLFYAKSNQLQLQLTWHNLAEVKNEQWLKKAALWAENKWGYIRGKGLDYRESVIRQLQENFFIVAYENQPVGMFALLDNHLENKKAKELMYFYVDANFRGLGVGTSMIGMVKNICIQKKVDMIVFDTLNPSLNKFYEKNGAKVVCEGQLYGHPTTVMRL